MINIGLNGATGKMGKAISERMDNFDYCKISAKFNSSSSLAGLDELCKNSDIVIDFSTPEILEELIDRALKYNTKLVIGTTGFNSSNFNLIKEAAKSLSILYSANMSLGANLLGYLAKVTSRILDGNYDIEILEAHHRAKKDAPSGTAIMLAEIIATEKELNITSSRGNKAREKNEIGITSLRGGNICGTHEVFFLSDDETITLKHEALNKNSFADGAIKAAIWLKDKPPALYSMLDFYENLINFHLKKHL
ncbi:MAG: 4-hydroxy-tetrahydrodipicolinate reductase [Rickettsia endosymbiont of Argas persicus]